MEPKMWSNMKTAMNRPSFIKNGLAAGAAAAGVGRLANSSSAFDHDDDAPNRGRLTARREN